MLWIEYKNNIGCIGAEERNILNGKEGFGAAFFS
jgi:hypothetical protein